MYILGILLNPENSGLPFPLILTGPRGSTDYFRQIDGFINKTLGAQAQKLYKIIIDNPERCAFEMKLGMEAVRSFRKANRDAFYFNWRLKIGKDFQLPFEPTHDNMASIDLSKDQPAYRLAAGLRRAFSGIVAGNVKEKGIRAVEKYGPFTIRGDTNIVSHLDQLLSFFVTAQRMKLPGNKYRPCYRIT